MGRIIPVLLALALVGASATTAATTPTYSITFTGTGTEHQVDAQRNIQDSGLCDAAEHVDVTATLAWTASWNGLKATGRGSAPAGSRIDGSTVNGTNVKDACGLDLSQAPPGWVAQSTCAASLLMSAAPQLSVRKTATSLVLAVAAPSFAVPVGASCSLNPRNDQLTAHVSIPLKKLNALAKRGSLVLAVGTLHPGPGDLYAPMLDCSQATKPYDGYRTVDQCRDALSWSGTLRVTRIP